MVWVLVLVRWGLFSRLLEEVCVLEIDGGDRGVYLARRFACASGMSRDARPAGLPCAYVCVNVLPGAGGDEVCAQLWEGE